jgi:hypothetical protein
VRGFPVINIITGETPHRVQPCVWPRAFAKKGWTDWAGLIFRIHLRANTKPLKF